MGEEKQDGYRSVLQALYRLSYGPPGRQARIPRRRADSQPPKGQPWASAADGGYHTPAETREPLDYPPLRALRQTQDMSKIYAEIVRVSAERENRYKDYEDMILDATIAAAIELMVDDACQFNREQGATVWVTSDNADIVKAGEELFDIIQLEERLFDWVFNFALYGDFFLQVQGQDGRGVLLVQDDWHPADVQRIDVNGAPLGFRTPHNFVEPGQMGAATQNEEEFWDPWEFVHFRLQASQRRRREIERQRMAPMIRFEKDMFRVTTRYGVSVVEAARRIYKQLAMVEQSMIISRMTRAILKYIYKVQCGTDAEIKQATKTVLEIRDLLTQQTGLRIGQSFEQQFSPPSGSEDIFLPIFGEKGDVTIETLGGENSVPAIVDIEYLRDKLFGAIKIPKEYVGITKDLPGGIGESSLLRLDIRYARTVKRIQRALVQGLTRLLQIHLAYKKLPIDPKKFAVEMDIVSTAEEEERKASLMSALGVARDLTGLNTEMRVQVPTKKFAHLVYTELVGLSGPFVELLDEAEEIPLELASGEGGVSGAMPGGEGMPMGDMPPEDMPPEDMPGADLDVPPEGAASAEELPGAELELPPEPGKERKKPIAAGRKDRVRAERTLKERQDKPGGMRQKGSLALDARQKARDSVTRSVRASVDVKSKLPANAEFGITLPKIGDVGKKPIREGLQSAEAAELSENDKAAAKALAEIVRMAGKMEDAERDEEQKRWKKVVEEIMHDRDVATVGS